MLLKPLDFIVLIAYFVAVLGIGFYFSRRQTTQEEYFLGGRRINWFLAGASVLATLLSSVSYLSVPGEMMRYGAGLFTENLGFFLIIPIVLYFIIPTLMRLPDASVYDYFERRFSPQTKVLAAAVFVLMRLIWLGLVIYTCSHAMAAMTGWSFFALATGVAGVTVIYTTMGGIKAVVWSDLMQLVVLAGGALAIPVFVAWRTGTGPLVWWELFSQAERASVPIFSWDPAERVTVVGAILSVTVWHICTHGADQIAAQRYLSTPSLAAARRSFWMFSIGNVALVGVLMACAVAMFYFEFQRQEYPLDQFQQQIGEQGDQVFPRFIATQLPAGLAGLLLAGVLAAAMSSLSSGMNSVAAVLSSGTYAEGEDREGKNMSRPLAFTASVGVVAIGAALAIDHFMQAYSWNLVTLMNRINHLFVAPLGAMFLGGVWFRRVGAAANLVGFIVGTATSFLISFSGGLFGYEASFTWIMPAAFAASLAAALGASFLFPRAAGEGRLDEESAAQPVA